MLTRRSFVKAGLAVTAGAVLPLEGIERAFAIAPAPPLTPFVDALPIPPIKTGVTATEYELSVAALTHKYHRDLPATTLWGYDGIYPGPTFVANRGTPIEVTVTNNVTAGAHPFAAAFDSTLPGNVDDGRVAVHLHGGETEPASDGNPNDFFLPGASHEYNYANSQHGTTLWYHDHAMGNTRLNVMAGLAGFYLLIDPVEEAAITARNPGRALPFLPYLIGLAIQDRDFFIDGSVDYPTVPDPGSGHDHWVPEYFANSPCVNGKVQPYLEVEPRRYRFRVLNGSQARFYDLSLSNDAAITVLGSDGGYLAAPVNVEELLIAPGERYDVVIDFTGVSNGTQIVLTNEAAAPYPAGDLFTDGRPDTEMDVMQFRVTLPLNPSVANPPLPTTLTPLAPVLVPPKAVLRSLFLNEAAVIGGPFDGTVERALLNDTAFMDPVTEKPQVGATEVWEIANTTMDTHPIHVHLTQFRLIDRQAFRADPYFAAAQALGSPPPVAPYLTSGATAMGRHPRPQEAALKDTVLMHPGEVTRILVKFAPQDVPGVPGVNAYPFDPTDDPGYVWHCHILEHEENDMMRPLALGAAFAGTASTISIKRSVASARLGKPFTLTGLVTPGKIGDAVVVEVKRPGSGRWSYSSKRLTYSKTGGGANWWYGYVPRMRGTYTFRARFAGDSDRAPSLSGIVTVSVR